MRAYNLATFLEFAKGVDDATWMFHLERGGYARWFRDAIQDAELASETETAIYSNAGGLKRRRERYTYKALTGTHVTGEKARIDVPMHLIVRSFN